MPRLAKNDEISAKKFIAQLLAERKDEIAGYNNTPSPTKISRILKEETGIKVTRQSITEWLKQDLSKYLEITTFANNNQVKEYDELMKSAKSIWNDKSQSGTDRTKAYNSYLRAKKQKEQLMTTLAEQRIKQQEADQPVYLLDFKPGSAKRVCPKCGNEFYDMEEKGKKSSKKN